MRVASNRQLRRHFQTSCNAGCSRAYVVKYVAKIYNRPRMLHSPTCGGSVVETVAVLPGFKNAINEDDKDVCTFVMIDHVCREMAVRDDISRHETSAADARATQSVTKHV
jgi:hypothetical protein